MIKMKSNAQEQRPAPAGCCPAQQRSRLKAALAAPGFKLRPRREKCRRRRAQARLSPARQDEIPAGEDMARAIAALESEAVRRALSGVAVPVFHQGRECGSTVKHSDQLLMFLLKTLNPGRFGAGRETPKQACRAFALDIDLSAAGEAGGGPEKAEADEAGPDEGEAQDAEHDGQ